MKRKVFKKILCLSMGASILLSNGLPVYAASDIPITLTSTVAQEKYSKAIVNNGYAAISSNTSVTKGCTISYNISVNTTCITENEVKEFINNNKNLFTADQYSKITTLSAFKNSGFGAELYINMIEIVLGYPLTSTNITVNTVNSQQQQVLAAIHNLNPKQYTLKGTINATGLSYIPQTPYSYLRVTSLKFPDNKLVRVVSDKVLVSDKSGSDDYVTGSGTLTFIPK